MPVSNDPEIVPASTEEADGAHVPGGWLDAWGLASAWVEKISLVGEVRAGCPNGAKIVGSDAKFSVFHLSEDIYSWVGLWDYMVLREAVGAKVEVVDMDMAELERQVQVGFPPHVFCGVL